MILIKTHKNIKPQILATLPRHHQENHSLISLGTSQFQMSLRTLVFVFLFIGLVVSHSHDDHDEGN